MKKKLNDLEQTHGKTEKFEPTTLAQIWGEDGMNKYKTLELSEYELQIRGMNKSDLQAHAANLGIVPSDDRERLTKKLVQAFLKHSSQFRKPLQQTVPDGKKPSDEVLKILSEGR